MVVVMMRHIARSNSNRGEKNAFYTSMITGRGDMIHNCAIRGDSVLFVYLFLFFIIYLSVLPW